MHWKENESTGITEIATLHGGEGTVRARRFFEGASRLPVRFFVWELDPGVSWGVHSHEDDKPQEEIIYCLEGNGTVRVDGQDVPLDPGDAVLLPHGSVHGFRNTGSRAMKLVLVLGEPR